MINDELNVQCPECNAPIGIWCSVRDFDGLMLERAISHDSRYEAAHEELRKVVTDGSEYV